MIFVALIGLVACSPPINRLSMAPLQSPLELRPLVESVMLRTVTLPSYAAAEEIAFETAEGLIASNEDVIWADDQQRAVTVAITRNMTDILNAMVGPEPWPFIALPDVVVDIQVERMLAGSDGIFLLTGQFYVGGDGIDFPNSTRPFAISKPMADGTLASIAAAQAEVLLTLSEDISKVLAR